MDPGERMLIQPVAAGEDLLGRAVTRDPAGGWVISDARAPGCEVDVKRTDSVWTREYREDLGRAAALSVGRAEIGGLMAQYEQGVRIDAKIHNTEVLSADLRGPCGDTVVATVKVGTGSRELYYRKEAGGRAGANVKGVPVSAEGGKWERIGGTLTWDTPQAWSFTVGSVEGAGDVDLEVQMPTRMTDGDQYEMEITAARKVWLVVLYQEADDKAGVLLPSMSFPTHVVTPDAPLRLPTMQVTLRDPKVEAYEKMVIYAFTDEETFEQFRPPAGELSEADALSYATQLPERLKSIPRRRWINHTVSYVIEPKSKRASDRR